MNVLASTPEAPTVDSIIGRNVDFLIWRAREKKALAAEKLGISPQSLSQKLNGQRPWTASEIQAAATRYRVPIDDLFKKLPDLDSNQKPIAFKSHYIGLDQLAEHRRAKDAAHNEVQRIRGTRAG